MTTNTNWKAAWNLAQSTSFARLELQLEAVADGCAGPPFSLTSGVSDDELVRLESYLNRQREHPYSSAAVACA